MDLSVQIRGGREEEGGCEREGRGPEEEDWLRRNEDGNKDEKEEAKK
jgi:hypothetical protein